MGQSVETYPGLVVDALAILGDELTVRLHVTLLKIVRKLVQVLVVREQKLSLRAVKVIVPDTNHRKKDGEVLLERRGLEMLIHAMRAAE